MYYETYDEVECQFQKLTSCEESDKTGYEPSFNLVFQKENEDINNIAITGGFGSGKSRVIKTYEKHNARKNFIHVSFAHFDGVEGEGSKDNYEIDIERKIINQLVQQISPKEISDSGFRIKRTLSKSCGYWL